MVVLQQMVVAANLNDEIAKEQAKIAKINRAMSGCQWLKWV